MSGTTSTTPTTPTPATTETPAEQAENAAIMAAETPNAAAPALAPPVTIVSTSPDGKTTTTVTLRSDFAVPPDWNLKTSS